MEHRTVILLGVLHQSSILLCKEECISGDAAIAVRKIRGAPVHFHPLADDFVLTAFTQAETGGITVGLGVFAKVLEAGVTVPRAACCLGIDFVQEIKYCSHGGMQAVEVQSIETNPLGMSVLIVRSE